jgi:transmembrane sensor
MSANSHPTQEEIAEASAWVAHLHGAQRTPGSDRGLQLWLKEKPSRALALELATQVWEEVGSLQGAAIAKALPSISRPRRRPRSARPGLFAAAAAVIVGVVAAWYMLFNASVSTGVGEQRLLTLEDGTQVILNTSTRIVVHYQPEVRRVELQSGEARFDVAKQPGRPFIVVAGDRMIKALGTSFVVRYEAMRTAVTLVEGKVTVSSVSVEQPTDVRPALQGQLSPGKAQSGEVMLLPGQRVTFAAGSEPDVDTPAVSDVVSWQRGEIVMNGMRLSEAVAEMNRYSHSSLSVASDAAANLVISGVFKSGDSRSFAKAVAQTYALQIEEHEDNIVLKGDPQPAYR